MPTLFVKFYLIHKIAPKFLAIAIEREFNKRAMALYTCVDKGNEKLAYDLNYLNISLQMVSEVI